jgi:hypothetical protein
MKRFSLALLVLSAVVVFSSGCFGPGSGTGAVVGGIAGVFLDQSHPWRGGILGATVGAVAGATIADISRRGAWESAESGKGVDYRTEDGRGRYLAEPLGRDDRGCRRVRERFFEDGKLVRKRIVTFCDRRGEGEERGREREEREED